MLIRLLPEQVEESWDQFRPAILEALPPYIEATNNAMTNILTAILLGRADVWTYVKEREVHGIVVTYVRSHDLTMQRQLEIYAVYGTAKLTPEAYQEAINTLKKYARSKACHVMIGYTAHEEWAHFLRRYGAKTEWRLLEWEL